MNAQSRRREAVAQHKRVLILQAARSVFEREGLEGASLRLIAREAGYTPAALYFHFDSKEAIYAELLGQSLACLEEEVSAAATLEDPRARLKAVAMAFFRFYAENPRDLDLGFYLFRGGMRPAGLGRERDEALNAALVSALAPLLASARDAGASEGKARELMVNCFAHATGLLLLLHTGRMRMFNVAPKKLMENYLEQELVTLGQEA